MPPVPVLALMAAMGLMTLVWALSVVRRNAGIIDIFWGTGFVALAWLYHILGQGYAGRKLLVAVLVTLWGVRLSGHILWRSSGKGEDYRYGEMRQKWGRHFPWVSLFTVFWLQAVILWAVSMPLYQAQRAAVPARLTWLDGLGVAVFLVGFVFEAVGDWQLARFRDEHSSRGQVLDRGLWRYTRHPNYFGDSMVWWGLFLLSLATEGSVWTLYSPVIMTLLLLKISGVALLEKKLTETRPGYREYVRRTSSFVPWPPRR